MRKLTPQDINKLINKTQARIVLEKLTVKVGDDYVIDPGLKIRDVASKVVYTVSSPVKVVDGGWRLEIERVDQDGKTIRTTISQDDADKYEIV
jgi:exopolysaccharide biosynthesis protein